MLHNLELDDLNIEDDLEENNNIIVEPVEDFRDGMQRRNCDCSKINLIFFSWYFCENFCFFN